MFGRGDHPDRVKPGPNQECVWDYPRPPALVPAEGRVRIEFGGRMIVDCARALRVLETSHPPQYYIPREDVADGVLVRRPNVTHCEWKGAATWYDLVVEDRRSHGAAWRYLDPVPSFADLTGHVAFYASRVDAAWIDDELVHPQEGDFYGGWIHSRIVGPFKGGPGTLGW